MGVARRDLSSDPGSAFVGAIVSEKKIILIKKIWACWARGALFSDPDPAFVRAIVSEKKINSAPSGQILIKKIWACRARRAPFYDPGQVFLGTILSEKKIGKEKLFSPMFPLNRYNSAPVGQIVIKKYGRVVSEDPFPMTPVSALRSLSFDPGPVFLDAILSEKNIVKEKFFFLCSL
ncbi:LOW QUALITY PROTEIN: hypothetical protein V1477_017789 [Vespula maculifrons]|uniref:Uncharacterized protein n=1 Tax=Vespula maculifrons TaxID=7453 RepID=A0ABD2B0G5_VESMC